MAETFKALSEDYDSEFMMPEVDKIAVSASCEEIKPQKYRI